MKADPRSLLFYSFWAINGDLDPKRLCRQLEEFQRAGLEGVVFHPRFYPGTPTYLSSAYLQILNKTILHAKSLNMGFWIYDENGWPSGTADGLLYTKFPEDVCQRLDLLTEPVGEVITSFQQQSQTRYLCVQDVLGIDCFNPDATVHFLETTHERYRTGLSAEAFDYVEAFFADEPESGVTWEPFPKIASIPWSRHMLRFLSDRFGPDGVAQLPLLFTAGEGDREFRRAYWELVSDLFCRGFLDPYRAWCERYGKLFIGHVKGEEHPLFQIPLVGSCQRAYRHFSIPGIDALERFPSNHFFPRQASSVARQFGDGRCMVEANGGSGWGNSPEDLEHYLLWLARQGLTDFVLHLSQYRLDSAAMHDWPPSQPLHLTWSHLYPEILLRVRNEMRAHPYPAADTLVIAPYRGIMSHYEAWELFQTNIHNADTYPDTAAGRINRQFMDLIERIYKAEIAYDVTDERTLEESAKIENGRLRLGRCLYDRVLLAEGCELSPATGHLIESVRVQPVVLLEQSSAPPIPLVSKTERSLPLEWVLENQPTNFLLLEAKAGNEGWFIATFTSHVSTSASGSLEIVFADDIKVFTLNGKEHALKTGEEGSSAYVSWSNVSTDNTLRFQTARPVSRPFVWLEGPFRVESATAFTPGPGETVKTVGSFTLQPVTDHLDHDLTITGFPFLRSLLCARSTLTLSQPIDSLHLDGVAADAIRLYVNDRDLGWTWRTNNEFRFTTSIAAGTHTLRIELVPSTFNSFGPHHYYRGDWFVVSPDQIKGTKNFADPADAPACTHVPDWHFKPLRLPKTCSWIHG